MKTIFCSLFLIFILSVCAVDAADDWNQKIPDPHPSARSSHAMAYIGEDKALLFGGLKAGFIYDDETWVYDLSDDTWNQKFPDPKPSARISHAMAYIGGDKVLLFGGFDAGGGDDETWVYDLSDDTWNQKIPASKPSVRYGHRMAYIGGDKVLLFGGQDNSPQYFNDTWVYDLSDDTWNQKFPDPKPSARSSHAMAYIGGDGVLLFGGAPLNDDTWVYDLSYDNWTQDTNTIQPSARYVHTLSETSMDGTSFLVLFGGNDSHGVSYDDETWTFGGGDYPLPVELSSFTTTSEDGTVTLLWRTETEVNNLGFDIYRSDVKDGKYTKVNANRIQGAGSDATPHDYSFTDENVVLGKTYYYYIEDVDFTGKTNKSDIIEVTVGKQGIKTHLLPPTFALLQNYPNPFNPETWIPFKLAQNVPVTINIYDTKGQLIRTIALGNKSAGVYITKGKAAYWNGRDSFGQKVASGIYYYTLQAGEFRATQKMVIMK